MAPDACEQTPALTRRFRPLVQVNQFLTRSDRIGGGAVGSPDLVGPLPGLPAGGTSDADKAQAAQALTMMKMMMQGMFVDVSMNVNGRIVKSNVPTEGSKVTLLQLDVDKLFGDPTAMDKLQAATSLKALAGIPGLKVPTEQTVTIEIAR